MMASETRHDVLTAEFAQILRDAGYTVSLEVDAGSKRVDLFAAKPGTMFTLEVVDTHYSGPLSVEDVTQLVARFADGHKSSKQIRRTISITEEQNQWLDESHVILSALVRDIIREAMKK